MAVTAALAFLTAIAATTAAIEGHADAGVVVDPSGHVASVSPTGFAWRDGIRPGQLVTASSRSDAVGGWAMVTESANGPIVSREAPVVAAMRESLPFALAGLAAGSLALAFLRLNRGWALPTSCLAFVCSSVPLFLANQSISTPTLALAALIPASWETWRLREFRILAAAIAVGATALMAAWLSAYLAGATADLLDQARRILALGGTGLLMAERAVQSRPAGPRHISRSQTAWILAAAIFIASGLALVYFAAFPAPIIAIVLVLGLLAAQPMRVLLGRRLELALMADLREYIAADVVEEERGRLARELHDAPLQELSAVIRRLELVPGAASETKSLSAIADELRSVAIDLHPPMLDDIGLAAALDFLAEQLDSKATSIAVAIEDSTGLDVANRPPGAVEFALYRIAREAVTNALQHANASQITIGGQIGRESIDIFVADNGRGLRAAASADASSRGRFGLSSMRRRAKAIGAELSIEGAHAGTRVTVAWRR